MRRASHARRISRHDRSSDPGPRSSPSLATVSAQPTSPDAYRVLGADKGKVAIVDPRARSSGRSRTRSTVHDLPACPTATSCSPRRAATVVEMTPDKKVVWKYDSKPKAGYTGRDRGPRLPAPRRRPDDDRRDRQPADHRGRPRRARSSSEIPLTVDQPDPHRDTRLVRKLGERPLPRLPRGRRHRPRVRRRPARSSGATSSTSPAGPPPGHGHEGHGTEVFGALRKPDGNTLIAAGNGNRVIEVNPEGKIVWSIDHDELPGIRLAWVTTLQLLPNGNLIVGNCHAGPENPAALRGHPRQEGRLDLQGLQDLRQRPGRDPGPGHAGAGRPLTSFADISFDGRMRGDSSHPSR